MAGTHVVQTRRPVSVQTQTKYQVAARCTAAGTLPDIHLFVYQVVQPSDPKDDVFQRVAEVTDFDNYGTSRNAAITSGTFLYRSAALSVNYDDILSANGAWKELSSRLNSLVEGYDSYMEEFLTDEEGLDIVYPTVDEGEKNALIADYEATLPRITTAEDDRDAEQIECSNKEFELRSLQERLQEAQADLAVVVPVQAALAVVVPSFTTATAQVTAGATAARALNEASSATPGEQAGIRTQLSVIDGAVISLNSATSTLVSDVQTPIATLVGALQARVSDLTQQVNAKQLEYNQCQVTLAAAQAAVDQARAERDAALVAVRAVCPDYVPS